MEIFKKENNLERINQPTYLIELAIEVSFIRI
jgi:hypothetical protein